MKAIEQKKAAEKFVKDWTKKSAEESEIQITQGFWLSLLQQVYGVQYPSEFISFEEKVRVPGSKSPKRIDGYIPSTKVLIEQKGSKINLDRKGDQSDDENLTPYEQAKRYADNLPNYLRPRWIVVSNFTEFRIHDLNCERPADFETVLLKDLPREYHRLGFLQDITSTNIYKEVDVSRKAGKLIGEIYANLLKQYACPDERAMHDLNVLCVRLVFCLFAEDAGIFRKGQFGDYLRPYDASVLHYKLHDLFVALSTEDREGLFIDSKAKEFDYVNGGLFADASIAIPPITPEVKELLVKKSSDDLDWSGISPTIFGAMFESTLNPKTRHDGGMHYTSVRYIHRVIDPLFMDSLHEELDKIRRMPSGKLREQKLVDYHRKLGSIRCLDPACGSGNFLTETYLSLRELENHVIVARYGQHYFDTALFDPIEVKIDHFYGIEINDFAVSVAKTAMWIAEYQMWEKTMMILGKKDSFLPLKNHANIHHGNALRTEWSDIVKPGELTYIVGNPPFLGYKYQSSQQKADLAATLRDDKGKSYPSAKKMDFVTGWFVKSAQMMRQNPRTQTALVSTNSVVQGEHVSCLWKQLVEQFGVQINFAWRSFKWQSESEGKAKVTCVIVGFGVETDKNRIPFLFDGENREEVKRINAYLMDYEDVWITKRTKPICEASFMSTGNRPTDGSHLIIEAEEYKFIKEQHPEVLPYVKPLVGSEEFINKLDRYCLWLKGVSPSVIRSIPYIRNRVELCREVRLASTDKGRQKLAETPWLFRETRNPELCLVVPKVSSERRNYIPIGFVDYNTIVSDLAFIVPDASLYEFGILTSSVHVAWTGIIGGRLETRYRYSNAIVYNNFPWPEVTEIQREEITSLAQSVLNARCEWPDCSLADLYDPMFMPPALRKAHKNLDRAVLKVYGLKPDTEEIDIVKHLLGLYKNLIGGKNVKPNVNK